MATSDRTEAGEPLAMSVPLGISLLAMGFGICRAVDHLSMLRRKKLAALQHKEAKKQKKRRQRMNGRSKTPEVIAAVDDVHTDNKDEAEDSEVEAASEEAEVETSHSQLISTTAPENLLQKQTCTKRKKRGNNNTNKKNSVPASSMPSKRVTHCKVVSSTLDVGRLCDLVKSPFAGAIVTFSGTTRNNFEGKTVVRLEYEAYESMAEKEMVKISDALRERWPDVIGIAMEHKVGACSILDTSVIIAVSSAHREAAFEAAHFAIDTLKAKVPVWKKEVYGRMEHKPVWKENKELFSNSMPVVVAVPSRAAECRSS